MRSIHIIAGVLALISGAVALYATKGSKLHRRSGIVFVFAMLGLTGTAIVIAGLLRPDKVNFVAALLTLYLVCTGLLTVRRTVEQSRAIIAAFMLTALAGSAYALSLGVEGVNSPDGRVGGIPPAPLFMFALVGFAGAVLDARLLLAGAIQGAHRLARHLWRMTFAMWIATASFFLGQADELPEPVRKIALLVIPVLLVAFAGLYSLGRLFFKRQRALLARATTGASA